MIMNEKTDTTDIYFLGVYHVNFKNKKLLYVLIYENIYFDILTFKNTLLKEYLKPISTAEIKRLVKIKHV